MRYEAMEPEKAKDKPVQQAVYPDWCSDCGHALDDHHVQPSGKAFRPCLACEKLRRGPCK